MNREVIDIHLHTIQAEHFYCTFHSFLVSLMKPVSLFPPFFSFSLVHDCLLKTKTSGKNFLSNIYVLIQPHFIVSIPLPLSLISLIPLSLSIVSIPLFVHFFYNSLKILFVYIRLLNELKRSLKKPNFWSLIMTGNFGTNQEI